MYIVHVIQIHQRRRSVDATVPVTIYLIVNTSSVYHKISLLQLYHIPNVCLMHVTPIWCMHITIPWDLKLSKYYKIQHIQCHTNVHALHHIQCTVSQLHECTVAS